LTRGHDVRVLDNLCSQVHGHERKWPPYLNSEVELMIGDVEDADALAKAVRGVDAVFHFAAMVAAGQSMYEIRRYTSANMSCIYGPHQFGTEDQGWLAHIMSRAMAKKPITIYGDGRQVTRHSFCRRSR